MDELFYHEPVLLNEAVDFLINKQYAGKKGLMKVYIDCTLGGGGYTKKILNTASENDLVLAIDYDDFAIEHCKRVLSDFHNRIRFFKQNFSNLDSVAESAGFQKVDGIVMDLGLSSYQLNFEDGFSYLKESPLDMRADKSLKLNAADVLNNYSEFELADIFRNYGELKYSKKIAKLIIEKRKLKKFNTTSDLTELINNITPKKYLNRDLSKLFQAIRIEVNDELNNLRSALSKSVEILKSGSRIVVVSYHSLEDRIVKSFFRENNSLKVLTKKPVQPSDEEIKNNIRSRSAKLRCAEKI